MVYHYLVTEKIEDYESYTPANPYASYKAITNGMLLSTKDHNVL